MILSLQICKTNILKEWSWLDRHCINRCRLLNASSLLLFPTYIPTKSNHWNFLNNDSKLIESSRSRLLMMAPWWLLVTISSRSWDNQSREIHFLVQRSKIVWKKVERVKQIVWSVCSRIISSNDSWQGVTDFFLLILCKCYHTRAALYSIILIKFAWWLFAGIKDYEFFCSGCWKIFKFWMYWNGMENDPEAEFEVQF